MALSCDQTADVEDERHRVEAAGASVQWRVDSWRIGDAGIQVTRCYPDLPHLTATAPVSISRHSSSVLLWPVLTAHAMGVDGCLRRDMH